MDEVDLKGQRENGNETATCACDVASMIGIGNETRIEIWNGNGTLSVI